MATIVRTPSKMWKAVIRKYGWPTTTKTFRTRRDAEDWSRRLEDEMVRGVYIDRSSSERTTFAAVLDRYLNEITPTKKASTQLGEKKKAKTVRAALGKYALAALTPQTIARYRDDRLAAGKGANTVRLELALISHVINIAIKEWRIGLATNPVSSIRKPSPPKGRERRLTKDEWHTLFKACAAYSNPMLKWIVGLARETGMRKTEIKTLRRSDVELRHRTIALTDTKNTETRTVPLSRHAVEILREALAHPVRPLGCNLIFFGELGRDGQRRPYAFEKAWNEIKKSVGLEDFHFHDNRHEAISSLIEGGLSDVEVATIGGHKTMQMLRRYSHLRTKKLVARLDTIQRD